MSVLARCASAARVGVLAGIHQVHYLATRIDQVHHLAAGIHLQKKKQKKKKKKNNNKKTKRA